MLRGQSTFCLLRIEIQGCAHMSLLVNVFLPQARPPRAGARALSRSTDNPLYNPKVGLQS